MKLHQPSKGRARVMRMSHKDSSLLYQANDKRASIPVLVIPCPSLKSARARKKWEEISDEEKVTVLGKHLCYNVKEAPHDALSCWSIAKAVLAVTEGRG